MSRILAVDDEADILLTVRVILRHFGHETIEATSGEMALDVLEREEPDAILLDIRMPGIDGLEVLERVRGTSRLAQVPVIMLSAYSSPATVQRATDLGCTAFVKKPFLPEDLMRTLDEVLQVRRRTGVS